MAEKADEGPGAGRPAMGVHHAGEVQAGSGREATIPDATWLNIYAYRSLAAE